MRNVFKDNNKGTPERRQWHRSDVAIASFEHILHFFLVFLVLTKLQRHKWHETF